MVVEASYFSRFELQFDTKATYDRMFYRHASYLSHFTYMTCGIPIFSPHSMLSIPFLISSVQEGHWEGWTLVGSGGGAPCLSSCSFWGGPFSQNFGIHILAFHITYMLIPISCIVFIRMMIILASTWLLRTSQLLVTVYYTQASLSCIHP